MRFSFGQNWLSYSRAALDEEKVAEARAAFRALTDGIELNGKRFLDIGFGQGLALFLAGEAGAQAFGLDLDPLCAKALDTTARFFPAVARPQIAIGSILDEATVRRLQEIGPFDVVHSWGVLHHTGAMTIAFQNAAALVRSGGWLILAIYNKHWTSPGWRILKRVYNALPAWLQKAMVLLAYPLFYLRARALAGAGQTVTTRGMNVAHDLRDWLGGYPYEYASPAEIGREVAGLGFTLVRCQPTRGFTGCNEFVLKKGKAG